MFALAVYINPFLHRFQIISIYSLVEYQKVEQVSLEPKIYLLIHLLFWGVYRFYF